MISSRKILSILVLGLYCLTGMAAAPNDSLTTRKVFARAPLEVLDMLRPSVRLDMLDYYTQADSIITVQDALGGKSRFEIVTDDYMKVSVSPVSTLEIKVLPYRNGHIAMTLYTVGGDSIASDTKVDFFDANLNPLPASKFLAAPDPINFFNIKGSGITMNDLKEWMPFQTVAYSADPGDSSLTMTVTTLRTLPKETREKLKAILIPQRKAVWTGSKFKFK